VVGKIVDGQVAKWKKEIVLLDQEHVNADKHGSQTIEQMREAIAAKVGENVVIARFACFRIGE
jgi:elongation factor Ts